MSSSAWYWKITFEPWLAFLHSSSDATHFRSERCVRCIPGAHNMRCLWKESMLCSVYTDFEAILSAKALRSEESNAESFSCLRKTVPCPNYRDWLHSRLVTTLKYSPLLAAKLNQLVFQCFPVKKYFECNLRLNIILSMAYRSAKLSCKLLLVHSVEHFARFVVAQIWQDAIEFVLIFVIPITILSRAEIQTNPSHKWMIFWGLSVPNLQRS